MHAKIHDFLDRRDLYLIRIRVMGAVHGIVKAKGPRLVFFRSKQEVKESVLVLDIIHSHANHRLTGITMERTLSSYSYLTTGASVFQSGFL